MVDHAQLPDLLSRVIHREDINAVEGLDPFRKLLKGPSATDVLTFLQQNIQRLEERPKGGVIYAIAEHYRETGQVEPLRELYDTSAGHIRSSVLNALWMEPGSQPMAACIVDLALKGFTDASPEVRTEACSVIQNQAGWKVDVSPALPFLQQALRDDNARVRSQAAYAIGNLAKSKYHMTPHLDGLIPCVTDADQFVRNAAAWALWQLSRRKHDIHNAIPALVQSLLIDNPWDGPAREATGALLHHARKSAAHADVVKQLVTQAALPPTRPVFKRFLQQLAET